MASIECGAMPRSGRGPSARGGVLQFQRYRSQSRIRGREVLADRVSTRSVGSCARHPVTVCDQCSGCLARAESGRTRQRVPRQRRDTSRPSARVALLRASPVRPDLAAALEPVRRSAPVSSPASSLVAVPHGARPDGGHRCAGIPCAPQPACRVLALQAISSSAVPRCELAPLTGRIAYKPRN